MVGSVALGADKISAWGTTARIRWLSSRSKPFIALKPTIKTATPSAIPIAENFAINATKGFFCLPR